MAVPTNYGVLSECSFCADRASMQLVRMGRLLAPSETPLIG